MAELNPYAKFLDGRSLEDILAHTPQALADLANAIGAERASERPSPGKWSAAEILSHLADCEIAFAFRLRQTLAQDPSEGPHVVQPFDQDRWAAQYHGITAAQALAAFTALRHWNLLLIHAALPGSANVPVRHPERGAMTFLTIVETMAGHDRNHLAQLERLAQAS
jgi:hypothetical protein